ncbi:MAG TPA: hypothetical protein VGQ15_06705 [Gaiellaceae bacterium]|nr:hypothetical protein [Gaiellaceae bacterium]
MIGSTVPLRVLSRLQRLERAVDVIAAAAPPPALSDDRLATLAVPPQDDGLLAAVLDRLADGGPAAALTDTLPPSRRGIAWNARSGPRARRPVTLSVGASVGRAPPARRGLPTAFHVAAVREGRADPAARLAAAGTPAAGRSVLARRDPPPALLRAAARDGRADPAAMLPAAGTPTTPLAAAHLDSAAAGVPGGLRAIATPVRTEWATGDPGHSDVPSLTEVLHGALAAEPAIARGEDARGGDASPHERADPPRARGGQARGGETSPHEWADAARARAGEASARERADAGLGQPRIVTSWERDPGTRGAGRRAAAEAPWERDPGTRDAGRGAAAEAGAERDALVRPSSARPLPPEPAATEAGVRVAPDRHLPGRRGAAGLGELVRRWESVYGTETEPAALRDAQTEPVVGLAVQGGDAPTRRDVPDGEEAASLRDSEDVLAAELELLLVRELRRYGITPEAG